MRLVWNWRFRLIVGFEGTVFIYGILDESLYGYGDDICWKELRL